MVFTYRYLRYLGVSKDYFLAFAKFAVNKNGHLPCKFKHLLAVLRIHEILVTIRIRIRGSIPLTNESGFGSGSGGRILLFSSLTFKMSTKYYFYYFLKVHLHDFSKIKSHKEVTKQKESRFFLLFLLDDRRIRSRIRIAE